MPMTPAQLTTLKAAIAAETDPAFVALRQAGATGAMADWYSDLASPAYIVWRSSVNMREVMSAASFDWTRVDNLSVGKARIWDWIRDNGMFNASQANIRAAIDATWVGTAADLAVRAGVYVVCKRSAKRIEKMFATGTGSDAAPATMAYEGSLSNADLVLALGS